MRPISDVQALSWFYKADNEMLECCRSVVLGEDSVDPG
jgi:hypothetical protein